MRVPIEPPINSGVAHIIPYKTGATREFSWDATYKHYAGKDDGVLGETAIFEARIAPNEYAAPILINGIWYWQWPDDPLEENKHLRRLIEKAFWANARGTTDRAVIKDGWEQFKKENGL